MIKCLERSLVIVHKVYQCHSQQTMVCYAQILITSIIVAGKLLEQKRRDNGFLTGIDYRLHVASVSFLGDSPTLKGVRF